MSWLSNHALNAMLTGASQIHRWRRQCDSYDDRLCQDRMCLGTLLASQEHWCGVHPIDKLPASTETMSVIVNSAPSTSSGEHWLAVRLLPESAEFFDSYGKPPWAYPQLYAWLQDAKRQRIHFLRQRLQGPQAYCGAYCYYFLSERPWCKTFYETFFNNPRHIFTALDTTVTDPESIRSYLSFNDRVVFHYLYTDVRHLLSAYACE